MKTSLFILAIMQISLNIIIPYLYYKIRKWSWILLIPLGTFLPFLILGVCSYDINILPIAFSLLLIYALNILGALETINSWYKNTWEIITSILGAITILLWCIFIFIWIVIA